MSSDCRRRAEKVQQLAASLAAKFDASAPARFRSFKAWETGAAPFGRLHKGRKGMLESSKARSSSEGGVRFLE
jgi:hypothetical protein